MARAGEPERIGVRGARVVVVSEGAWQRKDGSGCGWRVDGFDVLIAATALEARVAH